MGIFQKKRTLAYINKLVHECKYDIAYKLLNRTIVYEEKFNPHLEKLKAAIEGYQKSLKKLKQNWTFPTYGPDPKLGLDPKSAGFRTNASENAYRMFDEAVREAQGQIEIIKREIDELERYSKILD